MSQSSLSTPSRTRRGGLLASLVSVGVTVLIVALALGPGSIHRMARLGWRPHAPALGPIVHASLAVQVHLATVIPSFLIGTILVLGPKGKLPHRILGWAFTVLMTITAISALMIPAHGPARFSLLYIFSFMTLASLPLAVWSARRHNVARHSRTMLGLYLGGLVFAGLLAFLPGRLMWQVVAG
jgi:uncharacterized membrane protein